MMAIDEWLPHYQVSARYSIVVHASGEKTYCALKRAAFSDLAVIRVLMRLRGYRLRRPEGPESQPGNVGAAFLELADVAQREVVLGIAGRFWRPDGGVVRGITASEFRDFHNQGYAKAVWNFALAAADGGTQISTETRVQTFGRDAALKFRAYWLFVGPFSGLIRKAMLNEVKRIAEKSAA
ncbi:MAG: hypothetical protein ABSF59_08480 [Candidatus Sulfotelmatobacter sp.]|jgi:hypothetical protein